MAIGQDELQTEVIRQYLKIRYRLIPYLYTFVRQCYDTFIHACGTYSYLKQFPLLQKIKNS